MYICNIVEWHSCKLFAVELLVAGKILLKHAVVYEFFVFYGLLGMNDVGI